MNKNSRCYYESALKLLLPVEYMPEVDGFILRLGRKKYFFCGAVTPLNNSCSVNVAKNKFCMNKVLEKAGFPVPKAIFVHIAEFEQGKLEEKIADLSFPLVVKPQEGRLGNDVLCNVQTIEQLKNYMAKNFHKYEFLTVEEFHGNLNSYRVLVLNKNVIGVVQRYPAYVFGDGKHSLEELIELTNIKRLKISDTLGPIVVDEECHIRLNELGIDINHIPQRDEKVILGYTSNATRGGSYRSLGKQICKKNRRLFIRAAAELNLNLVGFDVQCIDINIPIEGKSQGVIIEANPGPSVRIHEHPMEGSPIRVTKKMLLSLIYRHPFSYLYTICKNQRSAFYIKSLAIIALGTYLLRFY